MSKAHQLLKKIEGTYYFRNRAIEKKKNSWSSTGKNPQSDSFDRGAKREIDRLYKDNYGKKIPYDWHREYTSYTGKFNARYIPELIFIPEIEAKFVDEDYECLADKNFLPDRGSAECKNRQDFLVVRKRHLSQWINGICRQRGRN